MGSIFWNPLYSPLVFSFNNTSKNWQSSNHSCPDHSRLVTVTSESQSKVLSALTDITGKPILAQPYPSRNTCTRPIYISLTNCLVYIKDWLDYGEDLLTCLVHCDAISVQCYTICLRGCIKFSTNIAMITLHTHYIPLHVFIGGECYTVISYQPPLSIFFRIVGV